MKHKKLHSYGGKGKGQIRQEPEVEISNYAQSIQLSIELESLEK